jgi:hypothetical protein
LGASEVILLDVVPGDTVTVTATPRASSPLVYDIGRAVINPEKVPFEGAYGLELGVTIPEEGEEPLNLKESFAEIDKILPMERLVLSPDVRLYLEGDLPGGTKIKVDAYPDDGAVSANLLLNAGQDGYAGIDHDAKIPVFDGTGYDGQLPDPALSLDGGKTFDILKEGPEALRLGIDVKLPDPCTVKFTDRENPNTIKIKPVVLMDMPLEFKILADDKDGNVATIRLTEFGDLGDTDLFDRRSAADPLINALGISPEEIIFDLDYVNTLGMAVDMAIVSRGSSFRKQISVGSGGAGTVHVGLKRSELPFPFIPAFEMLLPAGYNDNDGKGSYARLKILPGGTFSIKRLRADVTIRIGGFL